MRMRCLTGRLSMPCLTRELKNRLVRLVRLVHPLMLLGFFVTNLCTNPLLCTDLRPEIDPLPVPLDPLPAVRLERRGGAHLGRAVLPVERHAHRVGQGV